MKKEEKINYKIDSNVLKNYVNAINSIKAPMNQIRKQLDQLSKPMKEMSEEEKHELSKKKARKFKDKYLGTYEYYYYFQNVPDENYVIKDTDEKSGVN